MMHEFETPETESPVEVLYLRVEEGVSGFRWQVRAHERPDAVDTGSEWFRTEGEARRSGLAALERILSSLRRFGRFT